MTKKEFSELIAERSRGYIKMIQNRMSDEKINDYAIESANLLVRVTPLQAGLNIGQVWEDCGTVFAEALLALQFRKDVSAATGAIFTEMLLVSTMNAMDGLIEDILEHQVFAISKPIL